MTIAESDAIDAVHRFVAKRNPDAMPDQVVSVGRGELKGHDCWLVRTEPALEPGKPDWWSYLDTSEATYFVDAASGDCIGLRVGGFWHFEPKELPA